MLNEKGTQLSFNLNLSWWRNLAKIKHGTRENMRSSKFLVLSVPTSPEEEQMCLVYVIQPFTLIALYCAQNVVGTHWNFCRKAGWEEMQAK